MFSLCDFHRSIATSGLQRVQCHHKANPEKMETNEINHTVMGGHILEMSNEKTIISRDKGSKYLCDIPESPEKIQPVAVTISLDYEGFLP